MGTAADLWLSPSMALDTARELTALDFMVLRLQSASSAGVLIRDF